MKIGHKMQRVIDFVRENPGCCKMAAGVYAWNSWKICSMRYLYGPVNRAVKNGLIRATWIGNRYALYDVHYNDK